MYWRTPFDALASVTDLVEFTVLDVEPSGTVKGKWVLADAQVAVSGAFKSSNHADDEDYAMDFDSGALDQIYHTRTHLGGVLQPGDTVLGYHLTRSNFNSDAFASLPTSRIPDVVLVKKTYPNRRKKNKQRNWKLKSMAKEAEDGSGGDANGRGVVGRMGGRDQKKIEEDYELFLRDIEEDEEVRAVVNLYKTPGTTSMNPGSGLAGGKTRKKVKKQGDGMDMDTDEGGVHIGGTSTGTHVEDEEEVDFPEIKLDELLDDFDEMTLGEAGEEHESQR